MSTQNTFARLLFIAAIAVIILGFIGSIVLGKAYGYYGFNVGLFFGGLVSTLITGFIILGLAEMVNILDENRNLLKKIADSNTGVTNVSNNSNANTISSQLPEI